MATIVLYTTHTCPFCLYAKRLLDNKGVIYTEIFVDQSDELREEMINKSGGRRTVPQIFINDQSIGGYDDLHALDQQGRLDELLKK